MNQYIFYLLFAFLSAAYCYIGYRASRLNQTISDYFLAGRSLTLFPLTIALIATQLGGGVILGTSKEAYHLGLYGIFYVLSISIGFLVLACGFAGKLRSFNVSTTAQLFETRFNAPTLKKIASIFSMLSLCGILVAQVVASKNLMLSLGVYSEPLFWLFWAFVIIYTMMGGLHAVVNNDIFQLAFIMIVFCGIFAYECIFNTATVISVVSDQSCRANDLFTWGRLLAVIIIPACYCLIEQDIAQTLFAARTPRIALVGTFLAAVVMLFFSCIPVFFGMKARALGIVIPEGANPLISLFDQQYSPIIVTLVIYGVFAAIISTADALLCAISSHFIQDFNIQKLTTKPLLLSKISMVVIGSTAYLIGRYFTNIIDILVASYDIPVITLFVPLIACYTMSTLSKTGAYGATIAGLAGFMLFKIGACFSLAVPEAGALACSLVGYIMGYYYDNRNKQLIISAANDQS